jgi:hypothetical protein
LFRRSFKFLAKSEKNKTLRAYLVYIFSGDREHIHHKIFDMSCDSRKALKKLLLINFLFGVVSFTFFFLNQVGRLVLLFLLIFGIFFVLVRLRYLPGIDRIRYSINILLNNKKVGEKRGLYTKGDD